MQKNKETGLGDFMVPVIDLLSIMFTLVIEGFIKGTGLGLDWVLAKYFDKSKKDKVRKIEREDLKSRQSTLHMDSIGYSVTKKRDIKGSELDKRRHTLICGASGFGKTVLIETLILEDLRAGKPVLYIDPKGDRASMEQFINLCRVMRRSCQVFSEFYDGDRKICLNPMKEGSSTHIADRIHYSFDWSEEHYENLCYTALHASIESLFQNDEGLSFERLLQKVIDLSDPRNSDFQFQRKDVQGLITRLSNLLKSDFGASLTANGYSMRELWEQGECVYIGLPVLGYPRSARALGRILLGDLSYCVYSKYREMDRITLGQLRPLGLYIDELSSVISHEFVELLNKCRGVKMELNFAFQSPSDIQKLCPSLCEQILENASNWFVLKQRMEVGANTFSEAIGTVEGSKQTKKIKDGEEQDLGSQRRVEELVAHHNIIKNLRQGQCILLRHDPTQVDLLNIKYIDPEVVESNMRVLGI